MLVPKYIKTILKYASLFAVLAISIMFILIAKDNSQSSQLTQAASVPQLSGENVNSQVRVFSGDTNNYTSESQCASQDFFTSFPAKCLTSDGELIQVNEVPSEPIVLPEGK
jgi:hypothetical protein